MTKTRERTKINRRSPRAKLEGPASPPLSVTVEARELTSFQLHRERMMT
jgi:hypothetical protein